MATACIRYFPLCPYQRAGHTGTRAGRHERQNDFRSKARMGLGIFAERWMDQPFLLSAGWIYLFSLAGLIYNFGKARMGQTLSRKVRTDLEKFRTDL